MLRFLRLAGLFVATALGAAIGRSADPPPAAFLVGEPSFPAHLSAIDSEWNVTFRTGDKLRVVPAKDLAYWGRWREVEAGPQILLKGGGLVRADVLKLDERSLVLGDATGLGRGLWDEQALPLGAVQAILYRPPAGIADRDRLLHELAGYAGGEDRLLLAGGEAIAGVLTAAPLDGRFLPENSQPGQEVFRLTRRGADQPLAIPSAKVVALSLAALAPASQPEEGACWLGCRDGSLVRAASIQVREGKVTLRLAGGGELVTTLAGRDDPDERFWDEVTLVQPAGPRVAWLSDLKTLGYKHIPFLTVEWPYQADRSVTGGRLRSGRAVFLKGLGMHSASRLAYDVSGYRRFEAELALNDTAGDRGSVIFKVLLQGAGGDWQSAYASPIVRGGDNPLPISIDLKGAARMALIVEFADRADELDHANWLSARLTR
jgi:hypothetical protein